MCLVQLATNVSTPKLSRTVVKEQFEPLVTSLRGFPVAAWGIGPFQDFFSIAICGICP